VPDRIQGATYEERAAIYCVSSPSRARSDATASRSRRRARAARLRTLGDHEDGVPAYFLVVWDLIRFARESKIRVGPGRGSAASSCVAYCLRIVDLDPIRYDLMFERFLNPGRKEMPDIDLDFDERYRAKVIQYAAERYGADHVAQIVTFLDHQARAAVRDAARVLGYDYALGTGSPRRCRRSSWVATPRWPRASRSSPSMRTATPPSAELRRMCDEDVRGQANRRGGAWPRGPAAPGRHPRRGRRDHQRAAHRYLPVQRKPDGQGSDRRRADRHPVRDARRRGARAAKIDFLGLRNLSVLEPHVLLVEARTGERPDLDNLALDDQEIFAICRGANSIGSSSSRAARCERSCAGSRRRRSTTFAALVCALPAGTHGPTTCTTCTRTGRRA